MVNSKSADILENRLKAQILTLEKRQEATNLALTSSVEQVREVANQALWQAQQPSRKGQKVAMHSLPPTPTKQERTSSFHSPSPVKSTKQESDDPAMMQDNNPMK